MFMPIIVIAGFAPCACNFEMHAAAVQEYQRLRDAAIAIIRDMGVECGGSNVQMAVDPADGQVSASSPALVPAACMMTIAYARSSRMQ